MTQCRAVQEQLVLALTALRQAQIEALKLPTDVDECATAHITQATAAAEHDVRGAYYAAACLDRSMRGER